MINHEDIKAAEYIVRDSGAAAILSNGLIRDSRGRRPNPRAMELLLIGMFLSIHHKGLATVSSAYKTLTKDLPLDEQMRLGIYEQKTDGSGHVFILKTKLDHQVARIRDLLAYGEMSTPDLDDDERLRRLGVVGAFSATVMDLFDLGFEARHDATALRSQHRLSRVHRGSRALTKPAEELHHLGREAPRINRLLNEARAPNRHARLSVTLGGNRDDGRLFEHRLGAQAKGHLVAVEARQVDIHENQRGPLGQSQANAFKSIGGIHHLKALGGEQFAHEEAVRGIVFDVENARRHASSVAELASAEATATVRPP